MSAHQGAMTMQELNNLIIVKGRQYVTYKKKNKFISGIEGNKPKTVHVVSDLNAVDRVETKVPRGYRKISSKSHSNTWFKEFVYDADRVPVDSKRVKEWRQKHYWIDDKFVVYVKKNRRYRNLKYTVTMYKVPDDKFIPMDQWDSSTWTERREFYHYKVAHINVVKVFASKKTTYNYNLLLYIGVNSRNTKQCVEIDSDQFYAFELPDDEHVQHYGVTSSHQPVVMTENYICLLQFRIYLPKNIFHPSVSCRNVIDHIQQLLYRRWYVNKYGQNYRNILLQYQRPLINANL